MMASNDMDLAKIEQGVRLILEGVGEDRIARGCLKPQLAWPVCTKNALLVCIKTQPFILKRFSTNTTMKW